MLRTVFRLIKQGIQDLSFNPWAQIFTLAAVTLVAFLSGLFLMALTTLNYQLGTARGESAFQVYWHPGTDQTIVEAQWNKFNTLPGFTSIKTYSPKDALKELGKKLTKSTINPEKDFAFLASSNPLPPTALVFFAPQEKDIERWIAETTNYFNELPSVQKVVVTPLRDELGQAWRKVSRYVMWPSITFLTLVLGLVVGNTIRLSLFSRANEIEILKLVGAYNWYIRLPLIVGGAVIGFAGGLFALALLKFIHLQIYDALNFPPLLMEIQFLSWQLSLALVLVPMLMGMVASWLAVQED